jgi:type I restriction enzyme S subunit
MDELCEITSSKRIFAADYVSEGVPFYRGREITEKYKGNVDVSTELFITEEKFSEIEGKYGAPMQGDLLLTSVGTLVYVVKPGDRYYFKDGNLTWFRNFKELDSRFLYYWIGSPQGKAELQKCTIGSSQSAFTIVLLKGLEIKLPPLPVQQRIAGILSAYDELIENSQRRIRILETIARTLYREWFVHFRFPGHEKLPRVASSLGDIPQGWEVTTLSVHLAALESGKRPKGGIREVENGVPSIGAENINGIGRHDFSSEKFVTREFFQNMRKGVVQDRDVAIYKDGAYIGKSSYFRDGYPHTECCVNEHVFLLRADGVRLTQNAMYLWLQEPDTVHAIRATNANAAQPGINQQSVGGLELIVPDEKMAAHFDRLIEPLLAELINLAKRIQNLRRTRDLLLPRLLSRQTELEAN